MPYVLNISNWFECHVFFFFRMRKIFIILNVSRWYRYKAIDVYSRIQAKILNYIEEIQDENQDDDFKKPFDKLNIQKNDYDIKKLFLIIRSIIDNHHRNHNFFTKIEQIINYFKDDFKENFSNIELYNFFSNNKRIIIYLIQNEMLTVDESIIKIFSHPSNLKYYLYEIVQSVI